MDKIRVAEELVKIAQDIAAAGINAAPRQPRPPKMPTNKWSYDGKVYKNIGGALGAAAAAAQKLGRKTKVVQVPNNVPGKSKYTDFTLEYNVNVTKGKHNNAPVR